MCDGVVAQQQLALLLERARQVFGRRGRPEGGRIGLVVEHHDEHVLDRRQLGGELWTRSLRRRPRILSSRSRISRRRRRGGCFARCSGRRGFQSMRPALKTVPASFLLGRAVASGRGGELGARQRRHPERQAPSEARARTRAHRLHCVPRPAHQHTKAKKRGHEHSPDQRRGQRQRTETLLPAAQRVEAHEFVWTGRPRSSVGWVSSLFQAPAESSPSSFRSGAPSLPDRLAPASRSIGCGVRV